MASKPTIESIDASLARWKTRLKRAVNTIDKLDKQRKRLAKAAITKAPVVKVTSHPVANPDNVKLTFEPVKDDLSDPGIPAALATRRCRHRDRRRDRGPQQGQGPRPDRQAQGQKERRDPGDAAHRESRAGKNTRRLMEPKKPPSGAVFLCVFRHLKKA